MEIKFAESLAAPLLEATQAYLIKTGKERKKAMPTLDWIGKDAVVR